jgi:hypothetical protein
MSTAVIAAQDFGVKIGKLTTEGMLPYADLLKNTVITTTRTIEHTLDLFVGKISAQDFMAKMTEVVRTVMKEVMGERAPARERQGARAEGGPVAEGRTYLVGEKGPELFVANRNGIIIPNANRALTDLTPKLTQKQESVAPRTDPELPEAIASAFGTAINGPNGFTQIMSEVKKQIADDNRMSQTMLQGQIDKLTDLVNAMQDQVRASENIANALS